MGAEEGVLKVEENCSMAWSAESSVVDAARKHLWPDRAT
jgi:hypothetical protein